jgi:CheY-like chemotaxis protein
MAVILLVDDDAQTRNVLQSTLETAHHQVIPAQNGQEALQRVSTVHIDLVITDIWMPEKDGLEVIQELRRSYPLIKVLAYSGGYCEHDFDVFCAAKALGAHATLPKPFGLSELLNTVQHVLAGKA